MSNPPVDPERPRTGNAFDQPDGYSGQDYRIDRERASAERPDRPTPVAGDDRDIPPDNGVRAAIGERSGEVHGSGSGAGGGNDGEDFDTSTPSGDSYPLTGGEGGDKTPGDLGPPHRDETSYL